MLLVCWFSLFFFISSFYFELDTKHLCIILFRFVTFLASRIKHHHYQCHFHIHSCYQIILIGLVISLSFYKNKSLIIIVIFIVFANVFDVNVMEVVIIVVVNVVVIVVAIVVVYIFISLVSLLTLAAHLCYCLLSPYFI